MDAKEQYNAKSNAFLRAPKAKAISSISGGIGKNEASANDKIIHTWKYNGQDYLKSFIRVGESAYWRCWSRITIKPEMMGEWKVTITDTIGNYLDSIEFSIISTDE